MLRRTMSLAVTGLRKQFGAIRALDGLQLEVPERHVFGFLGSNGAGKTTTMRIALGVLRADPCRLPQDSHFAVVPLGAGVKRDGHMSAALS